MKNLYLKVITVLIVILALMSGCSSNEGKLPIIETETVITTAEPIATSTISVEKEIPPEETPKKEIPPKQTLENKPLIKEDVIEEVVSGEVSSDDEKNLTCTLSVRCDIILSNLDSLKEEKKEILPQKGIIYKEQEVEFAEGESVFDVLLREMQNNKIHFEYESTPAYNSVYVEGIANIYEFDCGEMSGWKYKVNGKAPSYGCSQYKLQKGDIIEWYYTCNVLD